MENQRPIAGFSLEQFLFFTDISAVVLNPSMLTVLTVTAFFQA